jgi:hypothetical protein
MYVRTDTCIIVTNAVLFICLYVKKLSNVCRFYTSSDISFNHSKTNMSIKLINILHVF